MGVAVGLAFALILLTADQYGLASLINQSEALETVKLEFVGVAVLTFALRDTDRSDLYVHGAIRPAGHLREPKLGRRKVTRLTLLPSLVSILAT
jgi:hypothetical protein